MTSPGQYGSHQYQSPETRALASITAESYDKDQAKTLIKLKNDVGYMAAYMRKMQKSIDQANENFIQQIQSFIADFIVLLGGGSLTTIDFGDLRYVIQAIGALLGFQTVAGIPIPINLFTAAWNFFGIYIAPMQQFADVINELIDAAIAILIDAFGEIPVLGQSIQQLAAWLIEIRDALWPLVDTVFLLIDTLSGQPGTEPEDIMMGLFDQIIDILLTTPDVLIDVLTALVDLLLETPQILISLLNGLIQLLIDSPTLIVDLLNKLIEVLLTIPELLTTLLTGLIELLITIPNILGELLFSLINLLVAVPEILTTLLVGLIELLISSPEILLSLAESLIGLVIATPQIIAELAEGLIGSGAGLLGMDSPINSQNLFNTIPTSIMGLVPVSHVGQTNPNILANPSFEGVESVQGSGLWFWDAAEGRTTPGSAYTTANGATRQLLSNEIPVSEGQKLNLSVFTKWTGLVYTGIDPIKIQVLRLLNYAPVGTDDLFTGTTPAANQATWIQAGADYTVPAGCDMICLQLAVAATATAGTVRFDDGNVHKIGLLQMPWVENLPESLQETIDQIISLGQTIFESLTGVESLGDLLDDISQALRNIPFGNVEGIGGPSDIGNSIQSTWDQWIGGLVGAVGTGTGLADLFNISQEISSRATRGSIALETLGIRSNKPYWNGLLPTGVANIPLPSLHSPTAPTFAVTQSSAAMGYHHVDEPSSKGVVSWQGNNVTNVTSFFVNIYRVAANGVHTLVHASGNIIGSVSDAQGVNIYTLPTPIDVLASETYGIEFAIRGSGTYNIVGSQSWQTDHPSVFPKRLASVRNSGTSAAPATIAAGSVSYGNNIPFTEFAITGGDYDNHSPEKRQYSTVGTVSVPIPTWANYVEAIACGGGGGGHVGGTWGVWGEGGSPGHWATTTWVRGTHFSGTAVSVSVTVGTRGKSSDSAGDAGNGGPGGASIISIPGFSITAAGGDGGSHLTGDKNGAGPGNQSYGGQQYVGGPTQTSYGGPGSTPGGAGAGGNWVSFQPGGEGGYGTDWLRFRQT